MPTPLSPALSEYLTVSEAAAYLGVSPNTVRSWDASGKLIAKRNPFNRYRLYRRADLESFLKDIEMGEPLRTTLAGQESGL